MTVHSAPRWQRLSWRVFFGTSVLVLLLLAVVLAVATAGARRTARASARRSLEQSADLVAQLLAGRGRSLGGGARVFVQGPYFRTLVAERRRDDILDQTFEATGQLEASWVFITDDAGTLIAKSDEPSAFGEPMATVPLVAGALRGQVTSGFGASGDSLLFQAIAVPIAAPGGMPFGVLVATRVLDSLAASDIATATNQAVLFYVLDANGRARATATSLATDTSLRTAMVRAIADGAAPEPSSSSAAEPRDLVHGGRTYLWHRAALSTAGGSAVGGYVVMRASDDALGIIEPVRRSLVIAALLGICCALLAAALTARMVARPVSIMARQVQTIVERGADAAATTASAHGDGETSTRLLASAEVSALAAAVTALVTEERDQQQLRTQLPDSRPASERIERSRNGPRALAFRSPGRRDVSWTEGTVLAQRYRIELAVGQGTLGPVFRARDVLRGETVALRQLRASLVPHATPADIVQSLTSLVNREPHRHLVRVFDVGEIGDHVFVSSAFVEGVSLASILDIRRTLDGTVVTSIGRQLVRALVALARRGEVHGDIGPGTVRVTPSGLVLLDDVGVAHQLRDLQRRLAATSAEDVSRARSQTPLTVHDDHGRNERATEYMAPELLIGASASTVTDVYALGRVLHECLVGSAVAGDSAVERLGAKLVASQRAALDDLPRPLAPLPSPSSPVQPGDRMPSAPPVLYVRHADLVAIIDDMMHPDANRRACDPEQLLRQFAQLGSIARVRT